MRLAFAAQPCMHLRRAPTTSPSFFPHSRQGEQAGTASKRLGDLSERYMLDITAEAQSRYQVALNAPLNAIARKRLADAPTPAGIQQLRVDLIETRAISTVNHHHATFAGFLYWCERNCFCAEGLARHCTRFTTSNKYPKPFAYKENSELTTKGSLHPVDTNSVTLSVYTGLRPGELCGLTVEDIAADLSKLTVRRSVTQGRKTNLNAWYVPSTWNAKWSNLTPARQNTAPLTLPDSSHLCLPEPIARGNLVFIASPMGHSNYSMLAKIYGDWIGSESPRELGRIWPRIKKLVLIAKNFPQ